MPLTEADQRRVEEAEAEAQAPGSSKLLVRSPPDSQKLGSITVMCLILNRTIGEHSKTHIKKKRGVLTKVPKVLVYLLHPLWFLKPQTVSVYRCSYGLSAHYLDSVGSSFGLNLDFLYRNFSLQISPQRVMAPLPKMRLLLKMFRAVAEKKTM